MASAESRRRPPAGRRSRARKASATQQDHLTRQLGDWSTSLSGTRRRCCPNLPEQDGLDGLHDPGRASDGGTSGGEVRPERAGAGRAERPTMTARMDTPSASPHGHQPGTSAEAPAPPPGRERTTPIVLVLVFVGFISLGLPDGLLGVAWPSIRQTFGLPIDALGALFLTTVCGYLAASLTSGWVVRRIGVGLLLALSGFATGACLLTFALAPTWAVVVSVGVLAGLGGGAIDAGLNSYVALSHSPRLLSWLHACFGLGAATGPAIMSAVLEAGHPWRLGYAIVGAGQLLLGLCFLLTRGQWQVAADLTPQPPLRRGEGEPTLTPALSQRERKKA